MAKNDRANFGSKLGVILASAGSAVGLGNIWRFPYETGNHGGAAFILIYLGCILLLGLPIMIAEFLIGRRSRANTAFFLECRVIYFRQQNRFDFRIGECRVSLLHHYLITGFIQGRL